MKRFELELSKGSFRIHGHVQEMGQDLLVSIWGGTQPHIGAVGIAIPRPSLKDRKTWSATSSTFTFVGHKEDTLAKMISEKLAASLRRNIVVAIGIHWDDLTSKEVKLIENLTQKLPEQILKQFRRLQDI
jgi:hypothetical protein